MIKQIKLGKIIHTNIEPFYVDENGQKIWNIPSDLEGLRAVTIDTLNWLISNAVRKTAGDNLKLQASNSKAILLIYQLLKDSVDIDDSNLTETQKAILSEFDELIANGYTDSKLLLNTIKSVKDNITKYTSLIDEALNASSTDELIKILEGI